MRDVMTRAVDGHDLRVRKKLRAWAAHRLHEIAFSAVNEQDRTSEAADESFDLPLRHRRRGTVAKDGIMFPTISPAFVACPVTRHVQRRPVGYQRKSFLQGLGGRSQ